MPDRKVLVLGSGGREHALCWHLKKHSKEVFCAPGNDGIALDTKCFNFKDYRELSLLIQKHNIENVIVGPEKYLADGVADYLVQEKIAVFGPTKAAAQLESDKAWAKDFCQRHSIPMARTRVLTNPSQVKEALKHFEPPYVLKASGLAAGKGVWIGDKIPEAEAFAADVLKSHPSLVIEEFLKGEELSFFAMVSGERFLVLGAAQDHKRLLENDRGPNTGGMGAYSPVPILDANLEAKIVSKILVPTIEGLKADGIFYRGFIFLGMMIVSGEPYLLEYNCRLGDPETQALLLRLKSPLVSLVESLRGSSPAKAELSPDVSLNVVVAAAGYPDQPKQGFTIEGLESCPNDCIVFHSGTKRVGAKWTAHGGRLFSVNTTQKNLFECQQKVYPWIESLPFLKDVTYRRDIAVKAYTHLLGR